MKNQPPPGLMKEVYGDGVMTIQNATSFAAIANESRLVMLGHSQVLKAIQAEAAELHDQAFHARALGQESVGKQKEEIAKYLLSLVASLPTKLRGQ